MNLIFQKLQKVMGWDFFKIRAFADILVEGFIGNLRYIHEQSCSIAWKKRELPNRLRIGRNDMEADAGELPSILHGFQIGDQDLSSTAPLFLFGGSSTNVDES